MSSEYDAAREVTWRPGPWSGAVAPAGLALLAPDVPQAIVAEIWQLLHDDRPSLTLVLDRLIVGAGGHLSAIPEFAVILLRPDGVHVALRGAVEIEIDGERVGAGPVSTWFETTRQHVDTICLLAPEADDATDRPVVDAVLPASRIACLFSARTGGLEREPRALRAEPQEREPGAGAVSLAVVDRAGRQDGDEGVLLSEEAVHEPGSPSAASAQEAITTPAVGEAVVGGPLAPPTGEGPDGLWYVAQEPEGLNCTDAPADDASPVSQAGAGPAPQDPHEPPAGEQDHPGAQGGQDRAPALPGAQTGPEGADDEQPDDVEQDLDLPDGHAHHDGPVLDPQDQARRALARHALESQEWREETDHLRTAADEPEALVLVQDVAGDSGNWETGGRSDDEAVHHWDAPQEGVAQAGEGGAPDWRAAPPNAALDAQWAQGLALALGEQPDEGAAAEAVMDDDRAAGTASEDSAFAPPLNPPAAPQARSVFAAPQEPALTQSPQSPVAEPSPSWSATPGEPQARAVWEFNTADTHRVDLGESMLPLGDHDGWTVATLPEDLAGELRSLMEGTEAPVSTAAQGIEAVPQECEARQALSAVCPDGHANPTNYLECRTCGAPLLQSARMIPCPSLGRVRSSSGDVVELDRPVLIGRAPHPKAVSSLEGRIPWTITVPDPGRTISRNHLLIELDEWSVLAHSLSASNGTVLKREGMSPMRLSATEPVLLCNGDLLDLGDGQTLALEDLP